MRLTAAVCPLAGALLAFAVASVLPIWSAWDFNEWEGVGYPSTFWHAEASFLRTARDPALSPQLWNLFGDDLLQLGGVVGGGYAVGWLIARRARRRLPSPNGRCGGPPA